MDRIQPRVFDDSMEDVPVGFSPDDDEIVTVGAPLAHVQRVEVVGPLTLSVEFDDGVKGTVRFAESYLHNVWAKLRDPAYFALVGIQYGAVSWPNEEPDMCPRTMHDEIVANCGAWVLH